MGRLKKISSKVSLEDWGLEKIDELNALINEKVRAAASEALNYLVKEGAIAAFSIDADGEAAVRFDIDGDAETPDVVAEVSITEMALLDLESLDDGLKPYMTIDRAEKMRDSLLSAAGTYAKIIEKLK